MWNPKKKNYIYFYFIRVSLQTQWMEDILLHIINNMFLFQLTIILL